MPGPEDHPDGNDPEPDPQRDALWERLAGLEFVGSGADSPDTPASAPGGGRDAFTPSPPSAGAAAESNASGPDLSRSDSPPGSTHRPAGIDLTGLPLLDRSDGPADSSKGPGGAPDLGRIPPSRHLDGAALGDASPARSSSPTDSPDRFERRDEAWEVIGQPGPQWNSLTDPPQPGTHHAPAEPDARDMPPVYAPVPPPAQDIPPEQAPAPLPDVAPAGRRAPWRRVGAAVLVVALLLPLILLLIGWLQFRSVERLDLAGSLSPSGSRTNYLIVGSDSREGISADDANAGALIGQSVSGQRADTILVLSDGPDGFEMLSLPRDTFVTLAGSGRQDRINAAFVAGPAQLIATVRQLGIPVHHYVEVDFVSFAGLVDAVGGVDLQVDHPTRDNQSGLDLPDPGLVELDGPMALAWVRSRHFEQHIDGAWRKDPTGDLGRVERQQEFMRSVLGSVGGTRNPIGLIQISRAAADGLRVDDSLSYFSALDLARRLRGFDAESVSLPVRPFRTSSGKSVLELVQPEAGQLIAPFAE